MSFTEAKEQFGKMLRWTEQPKDQAQADKTIYIGTTVQGFYVNKRDDVGQNESSVYEIQLPNGELVSFWGSDLLDGKFKEIPVGCEVRVTCLGTQQPKTPKGRAYLNFKVEFDASSRRPLQEAAPATAAKAVDAPAAVGASAPVPPPASTSDGF